MKLVHPYADCQGPWLKGNLHTHTTNSDGRMAPEEVVAHYAAAGFDFLCLSDHDRYTPMIEHPAMVAVPGVEVTAGGPHLLAVGVEKAYDLNRSRGEIIAEIAADDGLCILNHPNWLAHYDHWPQAMMEAVGPYHGIEIFNSVVDFLAGEALATDRWDRLLQTGRQVWGYANDDFHWLENGPRGWNMVCAAERTWPAIVSALKAGRFYASTGVTINHITVTAESLRVETADAQEIRFYAGSGVLKQIDDGPAAEYHFTGKEKYLRAECYGHGRQTAWTQPVFVFPEAGE